IATPTIVPPREPIPIVNSTDKLFVTLVYSRKTKDANKKALNKMEPNNSWGSSSSNVPSPLIACRNDHVVKIMGYGDYQIGNVTISRVYYVEGLGNNLFSVGDTLDTLHEIVEEARSKRPSDNNMDYACVYSKRTQKLLENVSALCPKADNKRDTIIATTLATRKKHVTFTDPLETLGNNPPKIVKQQTVEKTNIPILYSIRVSNATKARRSQPKSNTTHDKTLLANSMPNKNIEDHHRKNKSKLSKKNRVDLSTSVRRAVFNTNSNSLCKTCNECISFVNHDQCVENFLKSSNTPLVRPTWRVKQCPLTRKATSKVLSVKQCKPTGRLISLGEKFPLVRPTALTSDTMLAEPRAHNIPMEFNLVCTNQQDPNCCSKHMTKDRSRLKNFMKKFIGTVRFRIDHFGCLFSDNHDACVVAYINYVNASKKSKSVKTSVKRKVWKPTGIVFKTVGCIWKPTGRTFTLVRNVCPLTRIATSTIVPPREPIPIVKSTDKPAVTLMFLGTVKFGNGHVAKIMGYGDYQIGNVIISRVYYVEGLGHNLFSVGQFCDSDLEVAFRQHTCFIRNLDGVDLLTGSRGNNLQGLVRGLPKLKFEKDHLCSACAMGKSTKKTHKPKSEDTNQEKHYLLHMDLCGPMRVESVNGKKRNCTLIEAARTMLIYAQAPLFLWAEAMATACFTQNRSIIRLRHGKTLYELLHSKLPDLSFFHVFGALCYLINDSENLGKLQPKADIGIFIGYAPSKKAFQIYNRRTRRIVETIHVDFNELTAMASEQRKIQSSVILQDVGNDNLDIEVAHMGNDPLLGVPIPEVTSEQSSSTSSPQSNTDSHSIDNIIGNPSRPVSTRKQLATDALWKGYRIYNKRTRQIMETVHVTFDELTGQTLLVQTSLGPAPNLLTPGPINSVLVPNPAPAIPYIPPTKKELEILF
nr:hypothetical protein [Tanacetum cinerariifolium]